MDSYALFILAKKDILKNMNLTVGVCLKNYISAFVSTLGWVHQAQNVFLGFIFSPHHILPIYYNSNSASINEATLIGH